MAENEFEKRVQQKMDGFNLEPTPGVWNSIEARIRKGKKRRFLFWWILLLAGGIGTTIWLTTGVREKDKVSVDSTRKDTKARPVTESNKENVAVPDTVITIPVSPAPVEQLREVTEDRLITAKTKSVKYDQPSLKKTKEKEMKEMVSNNQDEKEVDRDSEPSGVKSENQVDKKTDPVKPQETLAGNVEHPLVKPGLPQAQKTPVIADSPQVKLKSRDEKQRMHQWGVSVSAGTSAFMNKFGFFNKSFSRANAMQAAPSIPLGNTSRIYTFRRGFSFSAELFLTRPVAPKLTLTGSMGYQYLSTQLLAGFRVNSSTTINNVYSPGVRVSDYYNSPGNSDNGYYTNRFHFLSLSGDLSWKFIDGKKFNMRWNNGLSYSRLLISNMLHYDYNQRIYYKDNKLLKKSQLFFNTALEIPVTKRFSISPFLSFSITPVLNVDDSLGRRYNNQGFRIRYLLNKK